MMPNNQITLLKKENERFNQYFLWLISNMPPLLYEEIGSEGILLIVHHLLEFEAQNYFSIIQLKYTAIAICLDLPDADLKILNQFATYGIKDYQTHVSKTVPPFLNISNNLRVAVLHFYGEHLKENLLSEEIKGQLESFVLHHYPQIKKENFEQALLGISGFFLRGLSIEKQAIAISMFHRATTRDKCQYEVIYPEQRSQQKSHSMEIILAWRNTPRNHFLYRLARVIQRHNLALKRMSASYNNLYQTDSILVLALELDGIDGRLAWEVANILDFVKELTTVKYFASFDTIDRHLVHPRIVSGNMGNLLRAMAIWIHQSLVHIDVNLYTLEHIEEGLCRHPELTAQLCEGFKYKFDPDLANENKFAQLREAFLKTIAKLDTGHEENDLRRKTILFQGMNFIYRTLKTNFYRPNFTALSFRLDPIYLDEIPFDRTKKFPELPYGIFFIKGMHFFGFHIRFRDLARGGLRTVFPEMTERLVLERNTVFTECYNLAYTQQLKNKEIPEGGAKGIILLQPYEHLESETANLKNTLQMLSESSYEVDKKLEAFRNEQKTEHLYQAQRSFIESLVTIINCTPSGQLKAADILDYWNKPEYLYLGPDENLHDSMIEWIANYSKKHQYKPGSAFISGKPKLGINHKEYGVTSLGINVYLEAILHYLRIDPKKERFTLKFSGGPDGDVAGNELLNLWRYYPKTAKVVALTDISGTIFDPEGLDLEEVALLVQQGKSIRHYSPQKLNENGFLVDKQSKRYETPLNQQTLCWRRHAGLLVEDWLSGNDMNNLLRYNVHQVWADIFIPAGGRPRTLNESNYRDFLDPVGKPTARAIIEGANLYLTTGARHALEELGVLIIKDSSANKTGVICSSFEVLSGLTLGDDQFLVHKQTLVEEILARLAQCAANEASLLLRTHQETGERLTDISDKISRRMNLFKDQLLHYFERVTLPNDILDPQIQCFLSYCLPLLRNQFQEELLKEIPEVHKKAIIACSVAAHLVYTNGLNWSPSVVDILPIFLEDKDG